MDYWLGNYIPGFDFDQNGEIMGSVDQYGICLLSDVNTNNSIIDVNLGTPGVDGKRFIAL